MAKSCWDVGKYTLGCCIAIGLIYWNHCLLVLCSIILYCWLPWDGSCSGKRHNPFIGYQYPSIIFALFFLLWLYVCQTWLCIHHDIISQLRWDWIGGWERFLHVFPVVINCEVKFGLGEWMPLCMNWRVSYWLDFMMDPWCWLWLSGYTDSVLCILIPKLDNLRVVLVGIK